MRQQLGELEELVLLIVGSLHPEAYAVSIRKALDQQMNRRVVLSSVHTVLNRLENKGYVSSEFGEASPERGGKRKRYFIMTAKGLEALKEVNAKRTALYQHVFKIDFNF